MDAAAKGWLRLSTRRIWRSAPRNITRPSAHCGVLKQAAKSTLSHTSGVSIIVLPAQ